ncbi:MULTISPECIES: hypothetical protein [Gordonia]|uniref:Uncharacterized protein n=1 Tax=Gordonia sputi NBRC 100414 TaxID=1089453 RepID=H5TYE9_9ACTN|nr:MULTISPECIES: hypothetical protein [Gordonia]NKY92746.1 hypothetical protein [Gordonia sputi]GAB38507.1 hypothetical protein GOSPT_045_01450 [Gordonia sputi NBRC 100414]
MAGRPFEELSAALGEALRASTRPKPPSAPKTPPPAGSSLSDAITHHYSQENAHADDND